MDKNRTLYERRVELTIDGRTVRAREGETILDACRSLEIDTPVLCFVENLPPVNVCRVCVVEVEGSRTLVPACSRKVEPGMIVHTDTPRVRLSRKLVLEFLASSVDLSLCERADDYIKRYEVDPARFGAVDRGLAAEDRDSARAGRRRECEPGAVATVAVPVKIDNDLYVRDYSKCILCYACVNACGEDAQNTFAIAVAGRGFDARISTEFAVPLPDSACVYCGNCIGVCPTGALMFKSEFDMRAAGTWDESRQERVDTICPYCGVGCVLTLHTQDNQIVKATSPLDSDVTNGHLCVKGRFGWAYVQNREAVDEISANGEASSGFESSANQAASSRVDARVRGESSAVAGDVAIKKSAVGGAAATEVSANSVDVATKKASAGVAAPSDVSAHSGDIASLNVNGSSDETQNDSNNARKSS